MRDRAVWLAEETLRICESTQLRSVEAWAASIVGACAAAESRRVLAAVRVAEVVADGNVAPWLANDTRGVACLVVAIASRAADFNEAQILLQGTRQEILDAGCALAMDLTSSARERAQIVEITATLSAGGTEVLLAQPELEIHLLGCMRVFIQGHEVPAASWLGRKKARAIFARLVMSADMPLDREVLADDIWPDIPGSAISARLAPMVWAMRNVLGERKEDTQGLRLKTTPGGGLMLQSLAGDRCDATAFIQVATRCSTTASPSRAKRLGQEAFGLYKGDFLLGETYSQWVVETRTQLRALLAKIVSHLVSLDALPDDIARIALELENALTDDPLNEAVCMAAMQLQIVIGNSARASQLFHATRDALGEQMGMAPNPQLIAVHDATIRHTTPA
jgi:DNA-binding SARP family transcriptional activator